MDARFIGLATILVILSGAGVGTLAVLRSEPEPIVLLQNDHPETLTKIEREGKRFTFSHGFLARRGVSELEVRISFIHSSLPPRGTDDSGAQDFREYAEVVRLRDLIGEQNAIADSLVCEVLGESNASISLFDLSRTIHPFSGESIAGSLATVFGRLESSGNITHLRGISDFFYEREPNIESLSISHGMNETFYSSSAGGPSISEAPKGGVVTFTDLRRGDVAMIEFTIVPSKDHMPERTWNKNFDRTVYQVVRVYADGELIMSFANVVEVNLL